MVKMVSLSDDAYELLSSKKKNNMSFSQVIIKEIKEAGYKKTKTKKDLLFFIRSLPKSGKKKENISENIDEVLYGKGRK